MILLYLIHCGYEIPASNKTGCEGWEYQIYKKTTKGTLKKSEGKSNLILLIAGDDCRNGWSVLYQQAIEQSLSLFQFLPAEFSSYTEKEQL